MMKNSIRFGIYGGLLVILFLVFRYPHLMISPGRLLEGHQNLTMDCLRCHTLFFGSTSEKCIACHKVNDIGLVTTRGEKISRRDGIAVPFHQGLISRDCIACHSDHQGIMVYRPIRYFSHDLLGSASRSNCTACHKNPDDSLHRINKWNCNRCHQEKAWLPAAFEHGDYFRLDHDHDVKCTTCHTRDDYSFYTCYECHEHSEASIREEHREEGIADYEDCAECHRSAEEGDIIHPTRGGSRSSEGTRDEGDEDAGEEEEDD